MNYAAKQGYIEIPRIISTDTAICMTGGPGWDDGLTEVNGPWEVRAAIRAAIRRGAQWLKVMASHRTNTPEYTQEELDAAVDESHRVGKKIAVHSGTQPSIQMCINAGFDTIEHGTYLKVEQAKQMAEKGIVWDPTITAYTKTYEKIVDDIKNNVPNRYIEHYDYFKGAAMAYKENFRKLYDTGVKIVTGTDVCYTNAPATPVHWELKYLVEYGMPPIEAIRAASKSGAETLDLDVITGELAAGKQADIVVVAGNPLKDITDVEKVREVFFGGKSVFSGDSDTH
jgi:imidazolonepropionase-like amidohydrolase